MSDSLVFGVSIGMVLAACGARTAPAVATTTTICGTPVGEVVATSTLIGPAELDIAFLIASSNESVGPLIQTGGGRIFIANPPEALSASYVRYGVADYDDFPFPGSGLPATDRAFSVLQQMTTDRRLADTALGGVTLTAHGFSTDLQTSQVEALYSSVTGAGLVGRPGGSVVTWIATASPCDGAEFGAMCFRRSATSVILLMNLFDFHNGPGGSHPYDPVVLGTEAFTYEEVVASLRAAHVRVPSLVYDVYDYGVAPSPTQLAVDTDAVDRTGQPIALVPAFHPAYRFDMVLTADETRQGSEATADAADEAIERTLDGSWWDVSAVVRDTDPADGVDATAIVRSITAGSADPASGIDGIDATGTTFLHARNGVRLGFVVSLAPSPPVSFDVCMLGFGVEELGCQHFRVDDCTEGP